MIRVKFLIGNKQLTGFEIKGHAMFAESGSDVVCAAVSSAAFMAANTITEIIGAKADASAQDGMMRVILNQSDEQTETVLRGLELHLTELSKQYPENIKIIYGGVK
ncbi:MAG: ribosomal-processing cysteine protease Prp [Clostridia bacterium]|nr:ribosomal-processing cysteine protease Prp [Clostridia bacterium]